MQKTTVIIKIKREGEPLLARFEATHKDGNLHIGKYNPQLGDVLHIEQIIIDREY